MEIVQGNSAMQPRLALVQNVKASQAAFREATQLVLNYSPRFLDFGLILRFHWCQVNKNRVGNKIRPCSPFRTELGVGILPDM